MLCVIVAAPRKTDAAPKPSARLANDARRRMAISTAGQKPSANNDPWAFVYVIGKYGRPCENLRSASPSAAVARRTATRSVKSARIAVTTWSAAIRCSGVRRDRSGTASAAA